MRDLCQRVDALLAEGKPLWLGQGDRKAPDGCAVVQTSGTTATPKEVVLSREALLQAAAAAQERLGYKATWHLALAGHYVAGLMVIVRGLMGQGVAVAGAHLEHLNPQGERNAISIVPTQLHRAVREPELRARLAQFDCVLVGGAPLSPALREEAQRYGINVTETYGMSETCGGVVWDGVPLPGIGIRIGEGERVLITGPTNFSGYLGQPELTKQTLIDGAVLTQDRGSWDGHTLTLLGRADDVIITGGINVDLAVVRRAVTQHCLESEVIAVPDAEWGSRIVLCSVEGDLVSWREKLRSTLPGYALPKQVIKVDRLPRSVGGKVDRQTLLELVQP